MGLEYCPLDSELFSTGVTEQFLGRYCQWFFFELSYSVSWTDALRIVHGLGKPRLHRSFLCGGLTWLIVFWLARQ